VVISASLCTLAVLGRYWTAGAPRSPAIALGNWSPARGRAGPRVSLPPLACRTERNAQR